jgi:prephenate dehydrogenase
MDFKNITIIGIGLIGGSLALALKKNGCRAVITGIGRNEANLLRARELSVIDEFSTDHAEGVKNADLVVIAASVGQFKNIAEKIGPHLKKGAVVTDVGSVKSQITGQIEPSIPEGVFFVGGHPIAGKESSGLDGASADLFHNARCILTPTAGTNREALNSVTSLWESVGMKVETMNPEEHDLIFASVSHMPHVIAYTMVNAILDMDKRFLRYSGGGLRDMTRIASSPEELWQDICSCNREEILKTLSTFSSSLAHTIKLIEDADWTGLEKEFKRAREARKLIESD